MDVGQQKIEDTIYQKVMSKKFRKLKVDENTINITKQAIHESVTNNRPVAINLIFGGNKLWRFDEAPEIDWAELFATVYLLRWMKSIASVYEPGAYLEFFSEDVVLETMNNLPKAETDKYSASFVSMLDWITKYLPARVSVGYKRYGDQYENTSGFMQELEAAKAKVLDENNGQLPVLNEAEKAAVEMNVKLRHGQSDDPAWREKIELIHRSIERTNVMETYIARTDMIPSCPTYYPGCIATGSTKKSYAKFWVAVGGLEKADDSYNEVVLTPKQLDLNNWQWEEVAVGGLTGKNFSRVRVIG